ncbi:MAG: carbohydrate-binding family 9-like protein [Armatimonadota bacterium]|nr:MAG: carbohydrate-binding family 9-like protein [Armatimonadota bacterium]
MSNMARLALLCVVIGLMLPADALAEARTYVCHRARGGIAIDGRLDDAGWRGIPWTAGFRRFRAPEETTPQRTFVKAAWDDHALYVALRVYDTDPWATKTTRDDSLWEEEVVEVYIDENGDRLNYREFEINPLGTVIDLLIPQAGHQVGWEACARWNGQGWRTAVGMYDAATRPHWVAEMAFPWGMFDEAAHLPPHVGDMWRIQFYRIERPRPGEELVATSWSPTPDFHVPEHFGRLAFTER